MAEVARGAARDSAVVVLVAQVAPACGYLASQGRDSRSIGDGDVRAPARFPPRLYWHGRSRSGDAMVVVVVAAASAVAELP